MDVEIGAVFQFITRNIFISLLQTDGKRITAREPSCGRCNQSGTVTEHTVRERFNQVRGGISGTGYLYVSFRLFLHRDCFAPYQGRYFDTYKRYSALAEGLAMTIPLKFASDFRHCDPEPKRPIEALKTFRQQRLSNSNSTRFGEGEAIS
jgi:hypothetical protein